MTFIVGLTGGIGSGKSKAADMFGALGADIVDTDAVSHALTGPGGAAIASIVAAFGAQYAREDGSLDRARMRSLVFSDPAARTTLEGILHPLIRAEVERRIAASRAPYVVLVVPLMLETGSYLDRIDRLLVVDCPEALQVERTMARSRLGEDEVRRIMAAQVSRAERVARANDVIANDADIDALRTLVDALHAQYLTAARAGGAG